MTDQTEHHVNESADKITLKAEVKRGSGTRDQDQIKVKVKGDDPQQTAQKLHETIEAIQERGTPQTLREEQPEVSDDE